MLRWPSGVRVDESGQALPEETSRPGKFPAATEEEEEGDAGVLVRPVRPVANNEAERNLRMTTVKGLPENSATPYLADSLHPKYVNISLICDKI